MPGNLYTALGFISLLLLSCANRQDWNDTQDGWPLARNPNRSSWHRQSSFKLFLPQPMTPLIAGFSIFLLFLSGHNSPLEVRTCESIACLMSMCLQTEMNDHAAVIGFLKLQIGTYPNYIYVCMYIYIYIYIYKLYICIYIYIYI